MPFCPPLPVDRRRFVPLLLSSASLMMASGAEAFGLSIPQPAGLSSERILSLARERYGASRDDALPMRGKVAVITGAAGGIGRELAGVVLDLGGTVVAMDRNETGLDALRESRRRRRDGEGDDEGGVGGDDHHRVVCLPTRHEDLESVAASAEEIERRFDAVHLLVNNAGLTYPPGLEPGTEGMRSKHGRDLLFTVNYLSHFLLVEKLLPRLGRASSPGARIVHLTSTYHFMVDGSELIPRLDDGGVPIGPTAYQVDPSLMSERHVGRSYANSKLAQIWHSRSVRGCPSTCACPTWAGTGIAGEANREFLERWAFPIPGAGVASALNAMFRSDDELGDALNDGSDGGGGGRSIVANSRILEYLPLKRLWLSDWATRSGWRDKVVDFASLILLLGQRYTFEEFLIQRSSPESYGNEEGREALYKWSLKEVEPWL